MVYENWSRNWSVKCPPSFSRKIVYELANKEWFKGTARWSWDSYYIYIYIYIYVCDIRPIVYHTNYDLSCRSPSGISFRERETFQQYISRTFELRVSITWRGQRRTSREPRRRFGHSRVIAWFVREQKICDTTKILVPWNLR